MTEKRFESFIARHSKASYGDEALEPEQYKGYGLTSEGVELGYKRVDEEIYPMYEQMPEDGVMVLIGASFRPRTKGTLRVFTEALKEHDIPNVIDEDWWSNHQGGMTKKVETIVQEMQNKTKEKFLVSLPLSMKEFMDPRWYAEEDGKRQIHTKEDKWNQEYLSYLKEKYGDDYSKDVHGWLQEEGQAIGNQDIPNPTNTAENYIAGIQRLSEFLGRFIPENRPLIIGICGHSGEADAFIDYLASNKIITGDQYKRLGGVIKETELIKLHFNGNKVRMEYRGEEFDLNLFEG